jgi:hypothetical protein
MRFLAKRLVRIRVMISRSDLNIFVQSSYALSGEHIRRTRRRSCRTGALGERNHASTRLGRPGYHGLSKYLRSGPPCEWAVLQNRYECSWGKGEFPALNRLHPANFNHTESESRSRVSERRDAGPWIIGSEKP